MSDNLLDLGRRPVIAAGEYGADGSALLDRYALIDSRMQEGLKADQFQVVVKTPEFGVVRLFADPPRQQGTIAVKWFKNLGLTDEELRSLTPGGSPEEEAQLKSRLKNVPVIVTVGIRQYKDKDTDEQMQVNTIKNIVRLG